MTFFKDILNHWANDWRTNRLLFWVELIGVLFSGTATTVISVMAKNPPMLFCYLVWTFGSGLLCLGSYLRRSSWMMALMGYYSLMNIVGLVNLVLR